MPKTENNNKDQFGFEFVFAYETFASKRMVWSKSHNFHIGIAAVELESEQWSSWHTVLHYIFLFSPSVIKPFIIDYVYRDLCRFTAYSDLSIRFAAFFLYARVIFSGAVIIIKLHNWHGTVIVHSIYKEKRKTKQFGSLFCNFTIITVKCMIKHYFHFTVALLRECECSKWRWLLRVSQLWISVKPHIVDITASGHVVVSLRTHGSASP